MAPPLVTRGRDSTQPIGDVRQDRVLVQVREVCSGSPRFGRITGGEHPHPGTAPGIRICAIDMAVRARHRVRCRVRDQSNASRRSQPRPTGDPWTHPAPMVSAMSPVPERAISRTATPPACPAADVATAATRTPPLAATWPNQAVTEVRRRVTIETTGHRGTAKDPIWAKRTRLMRAKENLSPEAFTKMWNGLVDNDPTGQILSAWIAKEELRKLLALAKTGGIRHDVAHQLFRFNTWCADVNIPRSSGSPRPSKPGGPRS